MNQFIVLTVVISVASAAFSLLLPKSETKKAFNVLLGAVTVFVIILPFKSLYSDISDLELDLSEFDYSISLSEESEEFVIATVEEGYEKLLHDSLKEIFDNVSNIDAFVKTENGKYAVYKIALTFRGEIYDKQKAIEEVYKITDEKCEVVFINE